ncbi:MAG TPA: helix-turn-helix domain-containing protein [Longimicrobium sp.]|jgi:AraC family transcriptional regulator
MTEAFRPVPFDRARLRRSVAAAGVRVTESVHPPSHTIAAHAHECATATLVLGGGFEETWRTAGASARQEVTGAWFRPAGEVHVDRIGRDGLHTVGVQFDAGRLDGLGAPAALFDGCRHVRSGELAALGRRFRRELARDDDASPLAVEALALELLALGWRADAARGEGRPPAWLARVRDRLHAEFARRDLRLAALAAEAGVHPVTLARSFRACYGESVGECVRRLRIEWSATALASGAPISRVALSAGFADQSHFTRAFRRALGVTPAEWRRRPSSRTPTGTPARTPGAPLPPARS